LLAQQADDSADNGVEADNLKSPMNADPRSNPTISNATFIGGKNSAYGLLLRRGTAGVLLNSIVTGFTKACIDIDDAETFNNGGLKMENTLLDCAKNFEIEAGDPYSTEQWFKAQVGNLLAPSLLTGWYPSANSPARGAGVTPEDLFFDPVDFMGAFGEPGDNWAMGWTSTVLE
jgi:hypothetical protein